MHLGAALCPQADVFVRVCAHLQLWPSSLLVCVCPCVCVCREGQAVQQQQQQGAQQQFFLQFITR